MLLSVLAVLVACNPVTVGTEEGTIEGDCADGLDNEGDGETDCEDAGCASSVACNNVEDDTGPNGSAAELYINEFMASNATTIADENGGYADWIELYNGGDTDVLLDGYTMTDDLAAPTLHTFSGGLLVPAGGFVLLWADGSTASGNNHLDFKLASVGEAIGLYAPSGEAIDTLTFEMQAIDLSAARVPDGSSHWEITDSPTPGESNGG